MATLASDYSNFLEKVEDAIGLTPVVIEEDGWPEALGIGEPSIGPGGVNYPFDAEFMVAALEDGWTAPQIAAAEASVTTAKLTILVAFHGDTLTRMEDLGNC